MEGGVRVPRLGAHGLLGSEGCRRTVRGGSKDSVERIADCLENVAVVPGNNRMEKGIMASEGWPHQVRLLLPKPRAADNICEQQSHGATRLRAGGPVAMRKSKVVARRQDKRGGSIGQGKNVFCLVC